MILTQGHHSSLTISLTHSLSHSLSLSLPLSHSLSLSRSLSLSHTLDSSRIVSPPLHPLLYPWGWMLLSMYSSVCLLLLADCRPLLSLFSCLVLVHSPFWSSLSLSVLVIPLSLSLCF